MAISSEKNSNENLVGCRAGLVTEGFLAITVADYTERCFECGSIQLLLLVTISLYISLHRFFTDKKSFL